jgi:hypothetical protein
MNIGMENDQHLNMHLHLVKLYTFMMMNNLKESLQ